MKSRYLWGLVVAIVMSIATSGCGSSGGGALPPVRTIAEIGSPEEAEREVYAAIKSWEFALAVAGQTYKRLNREGRVMEAEMLRRDAVAQGNLVAERLQRAQWAIELWRDGGDRTAFDGAWESASEELVKLERLPGLMPMKRAVVHVL